MKKYWYLKIKFKDWYHGDRIENITLHWKR